MLLLGVNFQTAFNLFLPKFTTKLTDVSDQRSCSFSSFSTGTGISDFMKNMIGTDQGWCQGRLLEGVKIVPPGGGLGGRAMKGTDQRWC